MKRKKYINRKQLLWKQLERVKSIEEKEQVIYVMGKVKNMFTNMKGEMLTERLLKRGFKNFHAKPLMVLYADPILIREMNQRYKGESFLEVLAGRLGKEYNILVLPTSVREKVRIEVWNAGNKKDKTELSILQEKFEEDLGWHRASFHSQVDKGIREAMKELGM